ncbi:cell division protein FtsB [Aeromicrobium panaciterrae]|uniref:Cell division protein FtsB n=1 Tax=Aeromicrobium panaciterrae TaxID=363861 RepID=A0ABU1ULM0_9ACTN|nr:DUF4349 domain-containing protein [Aeromicrobium panaciterrae]MDR7086065.1 cell division protein FtsB [Aeromicrobium panaciterrae]
MNAMLTDDRIETMRSTVMNAVDSDIKRRGTRTRRVVGLAAASVLVVGFGTFGLNAINGPNDGNDDALSRSSIEAGDSGSDSKAAAPDSAAGALTDEAAPEAGRDSYLLDADREVIVTGSVSVTVGDPRGSAQKVSAYVDSIGGRVDSRSESSDDNYEAAYLEVRVPSNKVTATIAKLKTYGSVTNVSLQNQDVTSQAQDLDARIDALKVSIKRLQKIMADATTSGELIKAEGALTQRQEQLESLAAQRTSIADQVQLSTLSIELSEKAKADSVSPGGFKGGVIDGWNALVSTLNNIVEFVGIMLPWAAIAVVLYGAYRLIARRREWN